MDKHYDAKKAEEKWYKFWEQNGYFSADQDSTKEPYSLLMPPPNLTGDLHLGHAMQHAILDAIARFKRMQGYDVLLLPGVDHAGIQFEGTLNKMLAKEGLTKQKIDREQWLKRAWEFKGQVYKSFHSTWTVMGISADWKKEVFSLEPKVQKAVFEQFRLFWEQDLLYKGAYIVQWCPKCATAIEDIEMEYEERKEDLYFVKYRISQNVIAIRQLAEKQSSQEKIATPDVHRDRDDNNEHYITIATARPETIFADTGIAIYPGHPKFAKFTHKKAINPLNGNLLPIFEDERVEKEFGTGALKITPGHDSLDYEIGQTHDLDILHVVDKTGRITELGQDLEGLKIEEAKDRAVQKLNELGAIEKTENYTHSVPICERCKTTVEPLVSEEWFVKMKPLAEKALKNIDKINFYPENYKKILSDWLAKIHDWSISRSLWWGHRIPVWYCAGKDKHIVVSLEGPKQPCKECGESHWTQEEKVLDTWFSSGLWPLAALGWPEWKKVKKYYPWDFELSSGEIKYLWIARMIMLGLWFADEIPFKNMFFHGQMRDLQGRKFSKSLGNGIDPNQLRADWGTDASRMALYTYTAPGRDGRASKQTMDERAKNFRNFGTKLWNIARFILETRDKNQESRKENSKLHEDDKWILDELNKTIAESTKQLESFQLHLATETIYNFVWHTFADVYIEKSKLRRHDAQQTLEACLEVILKLTHPFMPFITEEIWQKLPGGKQESIMIAKWPTKI